MWRCAVVADKHAAHAQSIIGFRKYTCARTCVICLLSTPEDARQKPVMFLVLCPSQLYRKLHFLRATRETSRSLHLLGHAVASSMRESLMQLLALQIHI